ncbi:O-fucosyltransferase family protein [Actinidia rufa]|uniref:O-fucosyltransferase family protein n=1 Tax=Actinidia rufa TaxID=165716 RepID=A0A7J0DRA0_9ERIC|nr:O-fucosyltransferase family protein [Actinidia rufa]
MESCFDLQASPPNKPQGYIQVFLDGGLNQQRMGICDAVAVAKILNATLVIPHLEENPVWKDSSSFMDIFEVDHFVDVLKNDIPIVKELPSELTWSTREYYSTAIRATRIKTAPVHASAYWYLENVLPVLQRVVLTTNRISIRVQPISLLNYMAWLAQNPSREASNRSVGLKPTSRTQNLIPGLLHEPEPAGSSTYKHRYCVQAQVVADTAESPQKTAGFLFAVFALCYFDCSGLLVSIPFFISFLLAWSGFLVAAAEFMLPVASCLPAADTSSVAVCVFGFGIWLLSQESKVLDPTVAVTADTVVGDGCCWFLVLYRKTSGHLVVVVVSVALDSGLGCPQGPVVAILLDGCCCWALLSLVVFMPMFVYPTGQVVSGLLGSGYIVRLNPTAPRLFCSGQNSGQNSGSRCVESTQQ